MAETNTTFFLFRLQINRAVLKTENPKNIVHVSLSHALNSILNRNDLKKRVNKNNIKKRKLLSNWGNACVVFKNLVSPFFCVFSSNFYAG